MAGEAELIFQGGALSVGADGLAIDGVAVGPLAREHGTPLYVYGRATLERRLGEMRRALAGLGRPAELRYAMKSNRFGPILELVRAQSREPGVPVKVDTCSPREIERALSHGFSAAELSLTAGMLSNRDLEWVAATGVVPNLDTFSVLRRWAATLDRRADRGGERRIGLRINPEVSVGWGQEPKLAYGNSKFGFDQVRVMDAAAFAKDLGLVVDEVHMHLGWGLQESVAPAVREAFGRLAGFAAQIPSVRTVNVGGGLCWKHRAEDRPLALETWAELVADATRPLDPSVKVACEPGTWLTAASGVLVVEVTTVEPRASGTWLGVDAGHAVNVFAAHYGIPMVFILVAEPLAPVTEKVNIGGNINEANDVFARGLMMPKVAEGELLALFPAGGYGSSMASDHCLRGQPGELLV